MTKSFLDLPVNSFSPKNFFKSGIAIGNGYNTPDKNMKAYPTIGKNVILNNDAAKDFLRLQADLKANFPTLNINLIASAGGGFRTIETQIAEFQERYSTNAAPFLASVNKNGANPKSQYFIEDSDTFRNNLNEIKFVNPIYRSSQYSGRNEPLIVNGEYRGIPPYDQLIQRVKDEHEQTPGLAGHNFLSNKRIKYYFPDGSKASGNWYYIKSIGITQLSTPGNSMHGWGVALDIHSGAINRLVANQTAMLWLIDHIQDYGWSRENGVDAGSDPYHLIYFGLGKLNKTSVNLKSPTIITSTTVAPKSTTGKFVPLQPIAITPKVVPTGPGNSIRLVKTIDAIIAPPVAYHIGQTGPGGGKIFITPTTLGNNTGRYFEVAPKNWYTGSKLPYFKSAWRNDGPTVKWLVGVGTTAVEIGRGYQNTLAIAARHAVSAAAYCRSYHGGGKTDWFLPSKNELNELHTHRSAIGGFLSEVYWSSTEANADYASSKDFLNGVASINNKTNKNHIRPIRSLPPTEIIPPGATPNYSIVSTYIPAIVTDSKSNNFLQHLQTLIESSPDLALSALNNYVSSDISQTAIDIQVDLLLKASKVSTTVFKFITDLTLSTTISPAGGRLIRDLKKHYTPDPSITAPVTVPIDGGGSGSKIMVKLPSFQSQKVSSIPSIKSLDGLSPKIFQVAEPYRGSNSPGGFLTQDEFFMMLIHPRLGNFSPAIAAIFTAIAQREGNLGPDKIGIGVANGSCHLGFLQIRCRPQDLKAFDQKNGWVSPSLNWVAPYIASGEVGVTTFPLSKKYCWEAFIQNKQTILDIKSLLKLDPSKFSMPNAELQKKVRTILSNNMPSPDFINNVEQSPTSNKIAESSQFISDWARIPANQILMMKSKFGLGPNFFSNQLNTIEFPYTSQDAIIPMTLQMAAKMPPSRYLFSHWDRDTSNPWTSGALYSIARDVLARNAGKIDPINVLSYEQALSLARKTLSNFTSCLSGTRKQDYINWLN